MTKKIRTRFAPSPTGDLHIGGARSALFAYLWAKKNKGDFILRIEDTDQARYKEGSEQSFYDGLTWLGIKWDEGADNPGKFGPYKQSERLEIYKKHVDRLINEGKAYRCFCTTERLDQMRKKQQENKQPPRYDRSCRHLSEQEIQEKLDQNTSHVVRLAVPEQGSVTVSDVVHGEVTFDLKDVDDQVLMKSDGFPTYHLAVVVDDHLMQITHVIRGEEWLPSTPKHVLLYQAFGWEAPAFVHLSLFLSKQGGKMSKRHGETSLLAFKNAGYLPEAVVNFIVLLGWNPKTEEEFFTMNQLMEKFDLTMINKANPVFETDKLDWMGQYYMKKVDLDRFIQLLTELSSYENQYKEIYQSFLEWFSGIDKNLQQSIWNSLRDRLKKLSDIEETLLIVKKDDFNYNSADLVWKKSSKEDTIEILQALIHFLEGLLDSDYFVSKLEEKILGWIKQSKWGNGDILWPMRFALTGEQRSPSPFECAELIGKDETIKRLNIALDKINKE